jgi:hypothetical protein
VPEIVLKDPHGEEENTMENMNFRLEVCLESPIEKSVFKNQKLRDKLVALKASLSEENGPVLIEIKLK